MFGGLRFVPRDEIHADSNSTKKEDTSHKKGSKTSKKHDKHGKRKSSSRKVQTRIYKYDDHRRDTDDKTSGKKRARYSDPSSASESSGGSLVNQHLLERMPDEAEQKNNADIARKAAGLEWMLKPLPSSTLEVDIKPASIAVEDMEKTVCSSKELNPYLKNGGDGYPSVNTEMKTSGTGSLLQSSVVGDGGVSWRLKALKRAKQQAEREGWKLDQVVEERWGSLAQMTTNISLSKAAHVHAHLHAARDRKKTPKDAKLEGDQEGLFERKLKDRNTNENAMDLDRVSSGRKRYLGDVQVRDLRMKLPEVNDSLKWRGGKHDSCVMEDALVVKDTPNCVNKFKNDGRFLELYKSQKSFESHTPKDLCQLKSEDNNMWKHVDYEGEGPATSIGADFSFESMTANQLAAKALQLRLQGKSNEAAKLLEYAEKSKNKEATVVTNLQQIDTRAAQPFMPSLKSIMVDTKNKRSNDEADGYMADEIFHNKQYGRITSVDDEYDFDVDFSKEHKQRKRGPKKVVKNETMRAIKTHQRIVTQEERCQFCFGNLSRPKHLVISIANSSYLMLPPWEPLVEGHCLIVPMQHEGSSRNIDDHVWEELRNYKKCLLQMFAAQTKDVLFMETAIHLSQQRRHCLVECIPLPSHLGKQAPLYFKKAIDEAEDEWSQHDSKKLIDTSAKGLRGCIPKNFPYFHVEFGLHAGYVHVIDNEKDFKSQFGQDVIIGMLKLPEEKMHRRHRQLSLEEQQNAAVAFRRRWDPFDWTKMLD